MQQHGQWWSFSSMPVQALFCKLHWLPVCFWVWFKVSVMIYKILHGIGPGYLRYCLSPVMLDQPCQCNRVSTFWVALIKLRIWEDLCCSTCLLEYGSYWNLDDFHLDGFGLARLEPFAGYSGIICLWLLTRFANLFTVLCSIFWLYVCGLVFRLWATHCSWVVSKPNK